MHFWRKLAHLKKHNGTEKSSSSNFGDLTIRKNNHTVRRIENVDELIVYEDGSSMVGSSIVEKGSVVSGSKSGSEFKFSEIHSVGGENRCGFGAKNKNKQKNAPFDRNDSSATSAYFSMTERLFSNGSNSNFR